MCDLTAVAVTPRWLNICLNPTGKHSEWSPGRLEAACRRALAIDSPTRKGIKSILDAKLDQHPDRRVAQAALEHAGEVFENGTPGLEDAERQIRDCRLPLYRLWYKMPFCG